MPAFMRKIRNVNRWTVKDTKGHIHAKRTTRIKAERQVSLLNRLHK